jgi:predicted amidohydrolase YtcJ
MLLAAWGYGKAAEEGPGEIEARIVATGVEGGFGDDLLRLEGVKLMTDGGISDRTAKLSQPYENEPENTGTFVIPPDELAAHVRWVHDRGWPMDCHTCGDVAQEAVVRAYVAAQAASPKPWLRHRVHHAYLPTAEALRLMAAHKIPALVSNPFLTHLGESFVVSLGEERAARMLPMRTYLDTGVPLAGSSDSPIADFNPWVGMAAAVNRSTVAGRVLGPEERITAAEALRSYTIGGAYATRQEGKRGSIEPGKLADLVVLDRDPLSIPPEELALVRSVATMLGGAWVFDGR